MNHLSSFSDLSVFHRIIIHLYEVQPRRPVLSSPFGLTQEGISSAVEASQNFTSVVLHQMISQGLVQEKKTHIEKNPDV